MKRIDITPRSNWTRKVQDAGCANPVYEGDDGREHNDWRENAAYVLRAAEVDMLKQATEEVTGLMMDAADAALANPHVLATMGIPPQTHPLVKRSWDTRERNLVMRLDWTMDNGVPKLMDINASPTHGLVLGGPAQLDWLGDVFPHGNQWNDIEMSLLKALGNLGVSRIGFAAAADDQALQNEAKLLLRLAKEAKLDATYLHLEDIGYHRGENVYTDVDNSILEAVYAMVPMEILLDAPFAEPWFEAKPPKGMFFEPVWVLLLQSKAFQAWLWNFSRGHDNLLPTYLMSDGDAARLGQSFVKKPFWGTDGANVSICVDGQVIASQNDPEADTPPDDEWVVQAYCPLPAFGTVHAVASTWVIGGKPAGLSMCEGPLITDYYSPVVPHVVE